ncbi:hypothetical protein [Micromonospora carbonacea]|uniref:Uncharacterized protein n=1 Tax=Micromonospora carbonacea TaxID=47853 RepID=A0A7H8XNW4_9ACTN|nr:hypothetical protein [Micromonospora carbonacea]MBB5826705.1 hypothetical protein [Micromonospora carbonacea]QLD26188.1 hypothetical protein HXZ27_19880 [Micromonospora carbonacea]
MANGLTASSAVRQPPRQRHSRPTYPATAARPPVTAVTVTAASSGPSRPGMWVGHGSPPRTTPPATAIGTHQPHDST